MESSPKIDPATTQSEGATNNRSTIEFPYGDLDASVEVARGIHNAGGNSCDNDQLAAQLKMEAKGGGFRLRINSAQSFGLVTYERGGRVSLTNLGRAALDATTEKKARMDAFLNVPLYKKVFEDFKGGALPPQAGLERAITVMGVGPKVADRARQVMLRSAKQAGFFDQATDRLIKPIIKDNGTPPPPPPPGEEEDKNKHRNGGGGGGGGDELHPLIRGLLETLPTPGGVWSAQERLDWLSMANSILKMIYKPGQNTGEIIVSLQQKETPPKD